MPHAYDMYYLPPQHLYSPPAFIYMNYPEAFISILEYDAIHTFIYQKYKINTNVNNVSELFPSHPDHLKCAYDF